MWFVLLYPCLGKKLGNSYGVHLQVTLFSYCMKTIHLMREYLNAFQDANCFCTENVCAIHIFIQNDTSSMVSQFSITSTWYTPLFLTHTCVIKKKSFHLYSQATWNQLLFLQDTPLPTPPPKLKSVQKQVCSQVLRTKPVAFSSCLYRKFLVTELSTVLWDTNHFTGQNKLKQFWLFIVAFWSGWVSCFAMIHCEASVRHYVHVHWN